LTSCSESTDPEDTERSEFQPGRETSVQNGDHDKRVFILLPRVGECNRTMAGYVCTIASGKGGVGKTTSAVNIAAVLEANGYDTAVVDADLEMANLGEMIGVEHDGSLHGVLAGNRAVSEVLTDAQGGITAVPGERSLEAYAEADPAKLRGVIGTLRDAYDVVLVDTGAGLSHETAVPLGLADGILLVTTPDDVSVTDTAKTVDLAERVDGTVIGVLVTRATRDTDVPAAVEDLDVPVVGVIPADGEATASEPLVLDAPDSDAADAYREVTAALQRVFFEGARGADLKPAVGGTEHIEDEPDETAEDDEDDTNEFTGGALPFG